MKVKNRLSPFLIIILVILVWIFIGILVYKYRKYQTTNVIKKIKLDDDLVQEIYNNINDDDILLLGFTEYSIKDLPNNYVINKATKNMTIEDINLGKKIFIISSDTLNSTIKMAFGPDFKYDFISINETVNTNLNYNDKLLSLNIRYDKNNNYYTGTYSLYKNSNEINVYKKLVKATRDDNLNLTVKFVLYKKYNNKFLICDDKNCTITKEVDEINDDVLDKKITISYKKASDDIFYFYRNIIDK